MSGTTKAIIWIIVIVIIVVAIWYDVGRKPAAPTPETKEPIKIGVLLSLTGEAAYFGNGELKAIQMAIDEINARDGIEERKIKLIIEDSGTLDTTRAITALRKLVDVDDVEVIIGPTWDMPGVAEVAEQEKVVLISPDNTEGVEGERSLDYFFSTFHPQKAEMKTLVEFSKEKGFTNVAVLRDSDIFSQTVASGFKEEAKQKGINIIKESITLTDSKDFRTELLKIKQTNPNAILATFASEVPRGPLLRQMKELGLNVPILGTAAVESQDLLENYGQYAENSIFYAFPKITEKQIEFLNNFKTKYGTEPTGPAAPNAYDAAKIVISALEQGARNSDEIKEILKTQEFQSVVFGTLKFDEKGFVSLGSADIIIKTIKNGQFTPLENQ